MKKKKNKDKLNRLDFDPEVLRMYMTGAANPASTDKFSYTTDEVDLHIEKLSFGKGKIAPQDALFLQLEAFEKALDTAIAAGKTELRVIHGLGKGKLRTEIHKLLEKHPQVASFKNEYHMRYGHGSTIVYFY